MPSRDARSSDLPPGPQTLEVTLIGPGYGESALVHVGDDKWIAVDSCEDRKTGRSAPLVYLETLGVDPRNAVRAIVISHYDDDHIRGIAEFAKACPSAEIIIATALIEKDFFRFIARIVSDKTRRRRTGAYEINELLEHLAASNRSPSFALPNRRFHIHGFDGMSHGETVEVCTLSPSDAEVWNFMQWVAAEMPKAGDPYRRLLKRKRNDVSVVVSVKVGRRAILLGADLEEEGKADTGWSAVLASRPNHAWDKAEVYKIAHHGSSTGHHPDVWKVMVAQAPLSALAPWINGGEIVPSPADRARIVEQGGQAYSTSAARIPKSSRRPPEVERTIRDTVKSIHQAEAMSGIVRFRIDVRSSSPGWGVELFDGALAIKDWPNA